MASNPAVKKPQNPGHMPPRFETPSALAWLAWVIGLFLVYASFQESGITLDALSQGIPQLGRLFGQMFPPDFTRLPSLLALLWQTFLMAVCGTIIGIVVSLPLAILAAKNLTPHPTVGWFVNMIISLFRTIPDLIWALIFVITVGLGPVAGALTIAVDTIGFLGKFFAQTMEEQDEGPQMALKTLGASKLDITWATVIPNGMPSFINDALFALEKATRSSVILGLVGAGGIGIELKVAMDLFNYQTATAIIIMIFALVIAVEQASEWLKALARD